MPLADYLDQYVLGGGDGDADGDAGGEGSSAGGSAGGEGGSAGGGSGAADELERGYLAQHPLLDQIPSLRRDICLPSVCAALTAQDRAAPVGCEVRDTPIVSAWVGPAGTVSPLHTDPFHNVLCQVIGRKYVRLYAASETHRLYPRSGALCNNSHIDLDRPSHREHPLFEGTPFCHAVLGPGEALYIPRHCWHYVRSLEPSVSVSFWWGARL